MESASRRMSTDNYNESTENYNELTEDVREFVENSNEFKEMESAPKTRITRKKKPLSQSKLDSLKKARERKATKRQAMKMLEQQEKERWERYITLSIYSVAGLSLLGAGYYIIQRSEYYKNLTKSLGLTQSKATKVKYVAAPRITQSNNVSRHFQPAPLPSIPEEPKEDPKEELKEETKEELKEESKEELKEESKEELKEEQGIIVEEIEEEIAVEEQKEPEKPEEVGYVPPPLELNFL